MPTGTSIVILGVFVADTAYRATRPPRMGETLLGTGFKPEHPQMEQIYSAIAEHIELDHITELEVAAKQIDYSDSLDQIMEALE